MVIVQIVVVKTLFKIYIFMPATV